MDYLYAFENIVEHKAQIIATLGGLGGVYMFVNIVNGKSYVGSTNNLANRFRRHYNGSCSNIALQNAFEPNKYGKMNFSFIVLAIVPPIKWVLLFLEQLALDFIKGPAAYNILKFAGTSLGVIRAPFSSEHRAKLGAANSRRTGVNNPMHGQVAANAVGVSIYTVDLELVHNFASRDAAADWLAVSDSTILRYIRSGKVFRGKYIITNSPL